MNRALIASFAGLFILAACGGPEPKETRAPTPEEVARAEAYLAENMTPLPEGWSFTTIPFDGDKFLRVGHAPKDAPKGTVIFIPGYTSSPELASDFMAAWDERGFEVASMDLPGQGRSVRREDDFQKTYTGDFGLYGRSVTEAVRYIDSVRLSSGPLIVAGDSFGGHALMRAAADSGLPQADALFPLVPATRPRLAGPEWLLTFFARRQVSSGAGDDYVAGSGPWSPDDFDTFDWSKCGDREDRNFKNTALFILEPDLRVGGATANYALGMISSGREMMEEKSLSSFDRPVNMVLGEDDSIVHNDHPAKICDEHMPNCTVTILADTTHCLYLEDQPTQDLVHAALDELAARAR